MVNLKEQIREAKIIVKIYRAFPKESRPGFIRDVVMSKYQWLGNAYSAYSKVRYFLKHAIGEYRDYDHDYDGWSARVYKVCWPLAVRVGSASYYNGVDSGDGGSCRRESVDGVLKSLINGGLCVHPDLKRL